VNPNVSSVVSYSVDDPVSSKGVYTYLEDNYATKSYVYSKITSMTIIEEPNNNWFYNFPPDWNIETSYYQYGKIATIEIRITTGSSTYELQHYSTPELSKSLCITYDTPDCPVGKPKYTIPFMLFPYNIDWLGSMPGIQCYIFSSNNVIVIVANPTFGIVVPADNTLIGSVSYSVD
jgi:hypothetical protein